MSDFDYEDQGYEADGGYSELSDRLDQLESAVSSFGEVEANYEYTPEQVAAESIHDGFSAREHLNQIAEQTRQQVFEQAAMHPQPAPTDEEIVAQAAQIASPAIDWQEADRQTGASQPAD